MYMMAHDKTLWEQLLPIKSILPSKKSGGLFIIIEDGIYCRFFLTCKSNHKQKNMVHTLHGEYIDNDESPLELSESTIEAHNNEKRYKAKKSQKESYVNGVKLNRFAYFASNTVTYFLEIKA